MQHDADGIIAAGRRAQKRRRAVWAGAGGFGAAAIAVVSVAAVSAATPAVHRGHTAAAPAVAAVAAMPSDPFTFTFSGYHAGKFTVMNPIIGSTSYQIASIYETGRDTDDHSVPVNNHPPKQEPPMLYGYLTLYRPGAFNPVIPGGHATTIAGHQAITATGPGETRDMTHQVVAWRYDDNVWAVAETYSNSADDPSIQGLSQLVAGLTPSGPALVTVPFRMSYVPAGYKLVETGTGAMPGLNGIAGARDGDYGGAVFADPAPATTGLKTPYGGVDGDDVPHSFSVYVIPDKNANDRLGNGNPPPSQPVCQNGFCNFWSADGKTQIEVDSGGRLSNAEMSQILKNIHLANVHAPSTWPAVSSALKR